MKRAFKTLPLIFAVLIATLGLSQDDNAPHSTPFNLVDSNGINASNLSFHLDIPIIVKGGRNLPFTFSIPLDTKGPKHGTDGNGGGDRWKSSGVTWGGISDIYPDYGHIATFSVQDYTCSQTTIHLHKITYTAPDNSHHEFPGSSYWDNNTCGKTPVASDIGPTPAVDGSGYVLTIQGGNKITAPSGTVFDGTKLTDSNGNQIIATGVGDTSYVDTLGKTVLTVTNTINAWSNGTPIVFTYYAPDGTTRTINVNFSASNYKTNYQCPNIAESYSNFGFHPTSISYPDGSQYLINYEDTPGFSGWNTGKIASIVFPTGGSVSFVYDAAHDGLVTCPAPVGQHGADQDAQITGMTATKAGATWTYLHTINPTNQRTDITDPAGTTNTYFFISASNGAGVNDLLPIQALLYDGSSLRKTIDICYGGTPAPCPDTHPVLPIIQRDVTTTLSGGLKSTVVRFFNSYGLVTEVDTYDFGPTLVSKTNIAYGSASGTGDAVTCAVLSNGIQNRPCYIRTYDSGNNKQSQITFTYDEGSLLATTNTPNHIPVNGSRGNATTNTTWIGGTSYLTTHATYFDTGNVATDTADNGAVTTSTYGACGNSFLTTLALPLSLSKSQTWDTNCDGAVVINTTDENNRTKTTSYMDSNFWRATGTTDELTYATSLSYLYDGSSHPTGNESSFLFNSGLSIVDSRTTLDTYGRTLVSQMKKGPSSSQYDTIETDHDAFGRVYRTTTPYQAVAGGTNPSAPAVLRTFDGLGRVTSSVDGGGGTTTYCYLPSASGGCAATAQGNDVLITLGPAPTGENVKMKQYEYDGLGRLTSVCELSTTLPGVGTCGQTVSQTGYWTKYTYDALGRLSTITQNAQGTPQVRSMAYDKVGRKTSESNPETGMVQFFYDTAPSTPGAACASATSIGSLVKTFDANGNTVCYEYDMLKRLMATKYPGGPNASRSDMKFLVYDTATVNGQPMQNGKGRLVEAYTCTGACGTKLTDIGYSYTARGELTTLYQKTNHSGCCYAVVSYSYFENGALASVTGNLSDSVLTSYGLNGQGQVQMVSQDPPLGPASLLVSNVLYNSAGSPTEVDFLSGQKDLFVYDANTMRWDKGTFGIGGTSTVVVDPTWNGNGTVALNIITDPSNSANNQTCTYKYDDLARSSSVDCGASKWQQNFTYDAFGNITKTVPPGGTGSSWIPGYNSTNNRFNGATYDNNGNLLTDGFHTYVWDSDNNLSKVDTLATVYNALGKEAEWKLPDGTYRQIVDAPMGRMVLNGTTATVRAMAALPGGGSAKYVGTSVVIYHSDFRGNAVVSTDTSGATVGSGANAPFGEQYAVNNLENYFMGRASDTVSGETDTDTRKYQWASGRFTQPDPAHAMSIINPQSFNLYAYVSNSPMVNSDPSGLKGDRFDANWITIYRAELAYNREEEMTRPIFCTKWSVSVTPC